MLQFILWSSAVWVIVSVLCVVAAVGKPRTPITGGTAAATVLVWGVILVGTVWAALTV